MRREGFKRYSPVSDAMSSNVKNPMIKPVKKILLSAYITSFLYCLECSLAYRFSLTSRPVSTPFLGIEL